MAIRALCIDDDVKSEKFQSKSQLLLEEGVQLIPIDNVDDALVAVSKEKFDIILLDIMMPVGTFGPDETNGGISSGLVLLRRIRNAGCKAPVIVVTVREKADIEPLVEELGITEILNKPSESLAAPTLAAIHAALGK